MSFRLRFLPSFFFILSTSTLSASESYNGSVSLYLAQKFFSDPALGNVNGTSRWGAVGFGATSGLYKFSFGLEPIVGFSFIKNKGSDFVTGSDGVVDETQYKYQLYQLSAGLRYRPWTREFFGVIPFGEIQGTSTYGRVTTILSSGERLQLNHGIELGWQIGGGFLISFFYDKERRQDMATEWGLKDFSLITFYHSTPSGFYKNGLTSIRDSSCWDFGLGMFLDW